MPPFSFSSERPNGRPKKVISRDHLENLLSLRLPISEIARTLDVSRPTLYSFMRECNMPYEGRFTNESDGNLRNAVIAVKGHWKFIFLLS